MRNAFSVLAVALAAVVLSSSGVVRADESRFAVVTIRNDTRDVTIHFSYRWGNGAWQTVKHLKPGRAEWIAIPLDSRGQAPTPQLKINEAIGKAQPINRVFNLRWKAAPDKGARFGHQYSIQRDRSNRDYVSLYDLGR